MEQGAKEGKNGVALNFSSSFLYRFSYTACNPIKRHSGEIDCPKTWQEERRYEETH
jgi:hypothetical protein